MKYFKNRYYEKKIKLKRFARFLFTSQNVRFAPPPEIKLTRTVIKIVDFITVFVNLISPPPRKKIRLTRP